MNVMQLLLKKYKRKINKVIKGGNILSILFSLIISLVIPPFNIYAETITSHVVGTNVWTDRIDYVVVDSSANQFRNYCNVHVEIVFDSEYVGWQNLGLVVYYYSVNFSNNTWNRYSRQVSGNYYINGNSLEIVVPISFDSIAQPYYQAYNGTGQTLPQSDSSINLSFTTQGNVVEYGELSTLEDILNILNDIYVNTSVDLYGELQNIVSNTSLSNQYLEAISKLRQWNPYFESYSFITYFLRNNFDTYTNSKFNYLNYPIFVINQNDIIYKFNSSGNPSSKYYSSTFIMYLSSNIYDINTLNSVLSVDHGEFSNFEQISYNFDGSLGWSLIKFNVTNFDGAYTVNLKYINSSQRFLIPIYANVSNYSNVSTEFALLFKLNNSFLDNINQIANGTNNSNTSSNNLENQKGSFDTTSNDLYTSENAFNTDMNNKLQSIDTSFNPSTSFGSKFLSSAAWVRTQFDNITSTTPFGTVLSFSMLLGLSLLIIGKVFK